MRQRFYLADLGEDDVILGYPWLLTIDEPINWIDHEQNPGIIALHEEWALEEGDEIIMQIAKTIHAQQFAEAARDRTNQTWEELVPPELHDFQHIFSEEASQRFPEPKQWDHAIYLLPNAPNHLDCKVYPLTRDEQAALNKFIEDHLRQHYIRPSNSPYAAPFFFVKKKDGKLRPVQDYRKLNQWTV